MKGNRLYKSEKLCSRTAINEVFNSGSSVIAYPLRAVFREAPDGDVIPRFMITVPKKKIRTAVRRVLLRRRIREAYRLNRSILYNDSISAMNKGVEMAFIYLDKDVADYKLIELKMQDLLRKISIRMIKDQNVQEG